MYTLLCLIIFLKLISSIGKSNGMSGCPPKPGESNFGMLFIISKLLAMLLNVLLVAT